MQSLNLNRIDSQWPTHAMLLSAGVLFYLALVGALLYTIVVLIHADEQPPPVTRAAKAQPVVLTPPKPVFAVSICTGSPEWDAPGCTPLPKASAGAATGKRHAHVATAANANAGVNNLLWAPPGAVWMGHEDTATATAPAVTLADASRGNGEWSATGAPHVLPVMASR